jgi:hypothetical protein
MTRQDIARQINQLETLIVRLEERGHAQIKAGNLASAKTTDRTHAARLSELERLYVAIRQFPEESQESPAQPALF